MSQVPELLSAALADRYRLERELGHGGMATVYLAEDLKHRRQVAIKVLRSELAAVLGAERFLKEIEVTARLQHPHILPLFDSGQVRMPDGAGTFLYYVMPYVEGESLHDRLKRESQLSVEESIRITREIASALDYAHRFGVIHRDIKPENILLREGTALLADFGIALAVTEAGGERLTETGMSVGTPQYMSPEQATGERQLDARSDLYGLAAVLYEMLAGEPPHTGPNPRAVVAKLMTAEPVPLNVVRPGVPSGVHRAVMRGLAKIPADRFTTVAEFATALTAVAGEAEPPPPAHRLRRLAWGVGGVFVIGIATGVALYRRSPSATGLDPNLIAVFPFRLSGTDTSHASLREGMVDVLETKFSGEGGPRVLPAQTAIAAWRGASLVQGGDPTVDRAAGVARQLRAGSLVLGTIVSTPGHVILKATLLDATNARIRAESKVEGSPDSLIPLVDALAARLVAMKAGMKQDRLATLSTSSLGALYAYLEGRAAQRAGRYGDAVARFDQAMALDSTFALAGVGYTLAANWADWQNRGKGIRLARAHQDRLSERDRLILEAVSLRGSPRDWISSINAAITRVPDDPDLLTQVGDQYFHAGALVGISHPNDSAEAALTRALALDTSLNVEPMIHLLQIAEVKGDTARVRRLLNRFPERNDVRDLLAAAALGDTAMLALARQNLEQHPFWDYGVMMDAQLFGFGIKEAEWAAGYRLAKARNWADSLDRFYDVYVLNQHLGRPAAARAVLNRLAPLERLPYSHLDLLVGYGTLGDEDTAVAARAAELLWRAAHSTRPVDWGWERNRFHAVCTVETWRLAHGDTSTARGSLKEFRGDEADQCGVMLRAMFSAVTHAPDSNETLEAFERQSAPGSYRWWRNLVLARLYENRGDLRHALIAARRRAGYSPPFFLSYALREEGRLAALAGDTAGAIEAYRHYLALRYNPEPSVKPAVDQVRLELARLVKEH